MDPSSARALAARWERDWNAHDVEALLAHVSPDVVFTSPVAARLVPDSGGVVRGREALRAYWTLGLARIPDLRFEVLSVFAGVSTVVITFRSQDGRQASEVLELEDGLVVRGHGTYLVED